MVDSGCIRCNLVDSGCDVRGGAIEIGLWLCGWKMVHAVFGCDVVKAMGKTVEDGGVHLSDKVS